MKPFIDALGDLIVCGERVKLTRTEEALVEAILQHDGFATWEQLGEAWGAVAQVPFDPERDRIAVRSHLANVRAKLPRGATVVSHRRHGYEFDVAGFTAAVPPRKPPPARKVARCGHPSTHVRQCNDCREKFFPCGHPRTQENSRRCVSNGYVYQRCGMCLYKHWRRKRARLIAEGKIRPRDAA